MRESIEVRGNALSKESHAHAIKEAAFPAGIEPAGAERHRRSPAGRTSGSERINRSARPRKTERVSCASDYRNRSRRESSESGDREMDFSPKGEQAGASESIEVRVNAFHQESQARNLREAAFPAGIEPTFKV
jgi:hypothetical protein